MSFEVSPLTISVFYQFVGGLVHAWSMCKNSRDRDDDLDLIEVRAKIEETLDQIHETLRQNTSPFTWTKQKADAFFNILRELQTQIYRYQETTNTRHVLNLQAKIAMSIEAYNSERR